jgi:hypothetical protein
VNPT